MPNQRFFREDVESDTLDSAGGSREAEVDDFVGQSDRFENLSPLVAGQRADAHFGHDFQHALGHAHAVDR